MRSPAPSLFVCAAVLWLGLAFVDSADAAGYRNFNLPCLAPLLEQVDSEAPATIDVAFLRGPTRAPGVLEGIGTVDFPITTASADAQAYFNQGVALLHGLSYKEAERSFRRALEHDADHPMIFWGLAMANEQRPQRARLFAQNAARRVRNDTTKRERLWIAALANFYNVDRDTFIKLPPPEELTDDEVEARHRRRIRDLEALTLAFPEDVEAGAFLLRQLTLDEHRSGMAITSHVAVDGLAERLAALAPEHPSRHYRIFLWLSERPQFALAPAAESAALAPAIADSWRYAAQAWRANGLHHHAVPLLEAAIRVDHRHLRDRLLMPGETENLLSNYTALVDALGSMGRVNEALEWTRRMIELPRTLYPASESSAAKDRASFAATGRRLAGETLLRAELPERLLDELESSPLFQPRRNSPRDRAHWLYWKALALAMLERFNEIDALDKELRALSKNAGSADSQKEIAGLIAGLDVFRSLWRVGVPDDASIEPPFVPTSVMARAWAKAGYRDESLQRAARAVAERPGQLLPAAAYCEIHFAAGQIVPAMAVFDRRFRANASRADSDLPFLSRLGPVAAQMQLPTRWTIPATELEVPGAPADPESLGLLSWSPAPAPAWSLPNHVGRKISLDDFKGTPVLLNFFLGVGCVYCAEQLNKFRPHLPAFEKAGIPMIAISTDSVEGLAQALGDTEEKTPEARVQFPYPILADPDLATFKTFGAFDDFENGGMHATVLIGPDGGVLWKNVSHGPFNHPDLLLEEARRLLALHTPSREAGEAVSGQ